MACSLLIGYSKVKQDQEKNIEGIKMENYEFDRYLNNIDAGNELDVVDNNEINRLLLNKQADLKGI